MDTISLPFMIITETLIDHGSLLSDKNHYPKSKDIVVGIK